MNARDTYDLDYQLLLGLRNRHLGRRGFIIGNGPSLRKEDLDRIHANGDLSIASNKIFLIFPQTEWRPTYYVIGDMGIAQASGHELAQHFPRGVICVDFAKPHIPEDARFATFRLQPRVAPPQLPEVSANFADKVCAGGTVTFTAMQLALWLGWSEVYLLGVDFDYQLPGLRPSEKYAGFKTYTPGQERNYFVEGYIKPNEPTIAPDLATSLCAFQAVQNKFGNDPAFQVRNATRGGKLDVFPRVEFDDLYPALKSPLTASATGTPADREKEPAEPLGVSEMGRQAALHWAGHLRQLRAATELAEACLEQSVASLRSFSFLDHLGEAKFTARHQHGRVSLETIAIDGAPARCLLLHPTARLLYTVPTGSAGFISFAVAMHPAVWRNPKCGPCRFALEVDGGMVCDITIDVRDDPEAWRWTWLKVPVPESLAGQHRFEFSTEGLESNDFRWALWRSPLFVWSAKATDVAAGPTSQGPAREAELASLQ